MCYYGFLWELDADWTVYFSYWCVFSYSKESQSQLEEELVGELERVDQRRLLNDIHHSKQSTELKEEEEEQRNKARPVWIVYQWSIVCHCEGLQKHSEVLFFTVLEQTGSYNELEIQRLAKDLQLNNQLEAVAESAHRQELDDEARHDCFSKEKVRD